MTFYWDRLHVIGAGAGAFFATSDIIFPTTQHIFPQADKRIDYHVQKCFLPVYDQANDDLSFTSHFLIHRFLFFFIYFQLFNLQKL